MADFIVAVEIGFVSPEHAQVVVDVVVPAGISLKLKFFALLSDLIFLLLL